ncbi:MAG: hypothetical protein Kow0070_30070 [Anaerolineales bacterium]
MKTYAYDSANWLKTVTSNQSTVNLSYNRLGQRLSMDAASVIAHYVMDGNRPLTAESNGNTTFYLYGLGTIGEKTTAWNYSLPDGTNTPRQLTNSNGKITLSSLYTPLGDTLNTFGTGNFSFGYLGGVLDATTGLIYVGNGQYYDPSTGRFLTWDVYPNSAHPYVPWNPIGAIVGPLGLIALVFGRRKKGSKAGTFLVLVLGVGSVGITLAGCGSAPPAGQFTATATATPGAPVNYTATFDNGLTVTGTLSRKRGSEQGKGVGRMGSEPASGLSGIAETSLSDECQNQIVDRSHDLGGVSDGHTGSVFVQGDIAAVVQSGLDTPMGSADMQQAQRGGLFSGEAGNAKLHFTCARALACSTS